MSKLSPFFASVIALTALSGTARSQEGEPLRLQGIMPDVRTSVTESWGTIGFTVRNVGTAPRNARVVVFYADRPEVQYARDVWVPGESSATSWLLLGPVTEQPKRLSRELEVLLYDRTDGQDRLVLPPGTHRVRGRAVLYHRREPTTALLLPAPSGSEDPYEV